MSDELGAIEISPLRKALGEPEEDVRKPPRYWGWRFNYAVECLGKAYQSARVVALGEQDDLRVRFDRYRAEIDEGMPPGMDEDDWERSNDAHESHLSDLYQEEETTLRLVTEAFIIALWHLWERQITASMYRDREDGVRYTYSHDATMGWLKRNGLAPQPRALRELKFLAETLKHSEGSSAEELFRLRRDLFDVHLDTADEAGYEWVRVDHATFDHFFDAVRSSGPQDRRIGF